MLAASAVLAAIAYAALVAVTKPFTLSADVVVGAGLAAGAVATIVGVVSDRHRALTVEAAPGSTTPWLLLLAAVVGWELFSFFGGPRPDHPTLSSLYDTAARWEAIKAAIALGWVALGWVLVRP